MAIEKDADTGEEIIWINEAAIQFGKSRPWFQKRTGDGRIRLMPQKGSSRIYLLVSDVKREITKGDD